MTAPARQMQFHSATATRSTIRWLARQFTTVFLAGVIIALVAGSAMAIGAFICNDVPRIVGEGTAALANGGIGLGW